MFIINGEKQGVKPIVTDAGQKLADEMGVPIGEEEKFYLQPPNRQFFRRAFRQEEKQTRSTQRKEFLDKIVEKPKADPTKLPTHMIHKIFKKQGVSIRWKQWKIGTIGTSSLWDNTKTAFNKPLFWKIIKRRGKQRAVRHEMEYASRVTNRAA